jgi:hypothetical protein
LVQLVAPGGQVKEDDMKNSHIGLACELLKLVAAVLTVIHAVMQFMGPATNYGNQGAYVLRS